MKKILLILFLINILHKGHAQKCLNISISKMMEALSMPPDAASSFKKCSTTNNERGQKIVDNYGSDIVQLDTMINRTMRAFTMASVNGSSASRPAYSQQDVSDAKALAETLKSMTPEQQKAWAQQVAQDRMKNAGSAGASPQDNAETSKTVFQTQDIAVNQMKTLNDEMLQKMNEINNASDKEISALIKDDKTKCPSNITGMPTCECVNQIEGKYWKQVLLIKDKYNTRKTALFQAYFPRLKAMAETVDNTVTKYGRGDALKSSQLKNMLFSSQSSAFGNAFLMLTKCMEDVRKDGSDAFVNKLNSDNKVFDISCATK
ncbi:MAG TPA: hypothetical protein VMT76_11900 [Puia sp.]|nr:hypothetical protein [Puia sp.]